MYTKDTVRCHVSFKDFDGKPITPEDIILTIYDTQHEVIETITTGIVDETNGKYYYDYVADKDFIFEFSGIYFGKPILSRQLVKTKFI